MVLPDAPLSVKPAGTVNADCEVDEQILKSGVMRECCGDGDEAPDAGGGQGETAQELGEAGGVVCGAVGAGMLGDAR